MINKESETHKEKEKILLLKEALWVMEKQGKSAQDLTEIYLEVQDGE
ncbi:hypothetical protein [Bacillus cereus]|uniref:Uncharacterized protein n=1 Tax=Bacillus cereus VD184 TaxID=1053242 RepID=A0A9W5R2G0_BACCE|nr:hypothetical protein [Bacillus cereus]EOQ04914.1 hypothetical protein IKC_06291 [Bacillus cereus VD184]